jgi:hypothetical protein
MKRVDGKNISVIQITDDQQRMGESDRPDGVGMGNRTPPLWIGWDVPRNPFHGIDRI